ncbi:MAG TPA: hypothetical protein VMN04_09150 [Thermoanaerobaculia bacterium]|nr:hypothetical protein [Thermoanaerobaculia bacterium]
MKKAFGALAFTVAAFGLGAPALAIDNTFSEFPEAVDQPIVIQLAGVWNSFDTQARLDVTRNGLASVGTTIDLEQLFGVPTTQWDFRGDGSWRISQRNYFDFGYSSLNRSGTRAIDADIVWNGYTYKAGASIDGKFDNYYGYVGWRYDIFQADNVRVWAGLSIAYEHLDTALNGQAQITNPDGTITKGVVLNEFSVGVPAPLIGLGFSGAISKHWTMDFYTRAIGFSTTDLAGSILETGLSFGWYPTRNFGVAGGADLTKINLRKYKNDNQTVSASYAYTGPHLGLVVGF